jgi:uncharacterized small protein (DUF1192 family)
MEDPVEPKLRPGPLSDLSREDLELLGVGELQERISLLDQEISRAREMIGRKQAGRSAADALFKL